MVVVVLIKLGVQEIQYGHLHHALVEVCGPILYHLDSHNLLCFQVLTLYDLPESTLTKDIQNEISILMCCFFAAQYVVDVQNVVGIVIVISVVLDTFTRLGKDTARVTRGFILKARVTDPVR